MNSLHFEKEQESLKERDADFTIDGKTVTTGDAFLCLPPHKVNSINARENALPEIEADEKWYLLRHQPEDGGGYERLQEIDCNPISSDQGKKLKYNLDLTRREDWQFAFVELTKIGNDFKDKKK